MGIANTLQGTRSLDEEQFNTLALRTAQFGGKLLRRVDQARAIVCASHLWWAVDSPYLPESEEKPVPTPPPFLLFSVFLFLFFLFFFVVHTVVNPLSVYGRYTETINAC